MDESRPRLRGLVGGEVLVTRCWMWRVIGTRDVSARPGWRTGTGTGSDECGEKRGRGQAVWLTMVGRTETMDHGS